MQKQHPQTSEQLTAVAPFDRLDRGHLHSLEPNIDRLTVAEGTVLASEAHRAHQLVILVQGQATVRAHGRTVGHLGDGALIGAGELVGDEPHHETVVTDGEADLIVMHEQALRWLLHELPDLRAGLVHA